MTTPNKPEEKPEAGGGTTTEDKPEVKPEDQKPPEETPPEETPPEETPPEETPPEGTPPKADEKDEEIERLKAENKELKEKEGKEPAKEPAKGTIKNMAMRNFVSKEVPEAREKYLKDDVTVEQQFDIIVDVADKLIGAVHKDHIEPAQAQLAVAVIGLQNELEIRDLRGSSEAFKGVETKVKEALAKMTWVDRAASGVVGKLFDKFKPASAKPKDDKKKPEPPKVASTLKDVAGGGAGAGGGKGKQTRLTVEQEKDRQEIEAEQGTPLSEEKYLAKLKTRQDTAKAAGRPEPTILRQT